VSKGGSGYNGAYDRFWLGLLARGVCIVFSYLVRVLFTVVEWRMRKWDVKIIISRKAGLEKGRGFGYQSQLNRQEHKICHITSIVLSYS